MPAAQSTKAEFKATTSIWDFCPEPFKTDFNISSLESESETTSFSLEIFSRLKSVIFISENRNSPFSTNINLLQIDD